MNFIKIIIIVISIYQLNTIIAIKNNYNAMKIEKQISIMKVIYQIIYNQ